MWSPQRYRNNGYDQGFDAETVDRAAAAIDTFLITNPKLPALLTLGHLARRVDISYLSLRRMVMGPRWDRYTYFRIRKRSGGRRLISVPEHRLMAVQRWIASHILSQLPVHPASFAFAPNSSIFRCAEMHCGARWLIKLDISGFFGSISEIQVYRVFLNAGYAPLVAFELARLCTHAPSQSARYQRVEWRAHRCWKYTIGFYRQQDLGFLPQGAPTSPMLSNLVMTGMDRLLAALAVKEGLTYTRYSDDITFSTTGNYDRQRAVEVIQMTTRLLGQIGLKVNDRKTRIVPPGARKVVLGLLVDGPEPNLSRDFRDRLRQHLHYIEKLGPEAHQAARGFDTISGLYRHVRGLIDFAKSVDAEYAAAMRDRFDAINWSLDMPKNQ
ncbi:reverse transcriptase family protein [Sphingopyxis sp.]|uniref:reverse transcriptase family protein n=1 Tax=Sphingopyxis sp. TaxID=1908224 RepID=UPI003D0B8FD8